MLPPAARMLTQLWESWLPFPVCGDFQLGSSAQRWYGTRFVRHSSKRPVWSRRNHERLRAKRKRDSAQPQENRRSQELE
jgi:hypothetical protein